MNRWIFLSLAFFVSVANAQDSLHKTRTLIVVFDGLRPDYITPDQMPNLFSFRKNASYGSAHHSVFPTVTRVNASSYVTGSYPHTHGLMGNSVYFPQVDKTRGLNTGDASVLRHIDQVTGNRLLTSPSLGEILDRAGERLMIFSSGSSGQAFIQNHTVGRGNIVNPGIILPVSMEEDVGKTLGMPPLHGTPNAAQHAWATRALLHYAFVPEGPLVSAIWYSDPDGSAHDQGIGSPAALQSLKVVDEEFGKILTALKEADLTDKFNIIITSDHGFITKRGSHNLTAFLIDRALKNEKLSDDVVLAGSAIYVKDHDPVLIKRIVSALQEQTWVGALFTRAKNPGHPLGWVEGTLSFETIHWDHASRSGDIIVDYNWDHSMNSFGYKGRAFSPGVAGHGGLSPYEIHIPLIASGPSFRKRYKSAIPTSNIDIVPTILYLHRLDIPTEMEGRVMTELLSGKEERQVPKVRKEMVDAKVDDSWGTYRVLLRRSVVGDHVYVDYTSVEREVKNRE
ncbi:MAG TPA: alkaline phosphatase family protein [Chryseosolibacter sp.]|nr:alkaline phosphatase family protein [Chryseosolibacter sp.]